MLEDEKQEIESLSIGVELLADIKAAFEMRYADRLSTADLLAELTCDEEAPWSTWNRGKPMSPRQLATWLKEFGVASHTIRVGGITPKGYHIEQFDDAFARYLPSLSVTSTPGVTDRKGRKASNGATCDVVTDRNPGNGKSRHRSADPEYT